MHMILYMYYYYKYIYAYHHLCNKGPNLLSSSIPISLPDLSLEPQVAEKRALLNFNVADTEELQKRYLKRLLLGGENGS